jgi:hypothetical protein
VPNWGIELCRRPIFQNLDSCKNWVIFCSQLLPTLMLIFCKSRNLNMNSNSLCDQSFLECIYFCFLKFILKFIVFYLDCSSEYLPGPGSSSLTHLHQILDPQYSALTALKISLNMPCKILPVTSCRTSACGDS